MNYLNWLWKWLQLRESRRAVTPFDFETKLSSLRLEDRRVLSVTPVLVNGTLTVTLDAVGDTAKLSVSTVNNVATIHVTDQLNVTHDFTESAVNHLDIQGTGVAAQSVIVSPGSQTLDVGFVTIQNVSDVSIQSQVLSHSDSMSIVALNDLTISGLGTLTADDPATLLDHLDISLAAGHNLTAQQISATGNLTLTDLSVATGTGIFLNNHFSVSGSMTFDGSVHLPTSNTLTSTGGGDIEFHSTVDGPGGLTVNTSGVTTFDGTVGGTQVLTFLTTDSAGSTSLHADITTLGPIQFKDNVAVTHDVTVTINNLPAVGITELNFGKTIDGDYDVVLNNPGTTRLVGAIGGMNPLSSLTTNGMGLLVLDAAINTVGAIQFNDRVSLIQDVTLTSSNGGNIGLASMVDGGVNLSVNTSGITTFAGSVGSATALSSLTTDASGSTSLNANVTTTGPITFNDAVSLTGPVVVTNKGSGPSGSVDFKSTITGPFSLAVNSAGVTNFRGDVNVATLTTDAAGSTSLRAKVTTSGPMLFNDAVNLPNSVTLTSTGGVASGNIEFASTVDGPGGLTVNTAGVTYFDGVVGGSQALTFLTTDSAGSTCLHADVTTLGPIQFKDNVNVTHDVSVTINNLPAVGITELNFGKTIDGNYNVVFNNPGTTRLVGIIGGNSPLSSLTTNGMGLLVLNAAINTVGAIQMNDKVSLIQDVTLTSSNGGNIGFASTVNGGVNLSVNTSGITTFAGSVGGTTALSSLTTDAPGSTSLQANVNTTGPITFNDSVNLTKDVTLSSSGTGSAGKIDFESTVSGNYVLVVNTSGLTNFGDTVAIGSLLTDLPGSTTLHARVVTTGNQSYLDPLLLTQSLELVTTSNGSLLVGSSVELGGNDLRLAAAGTGDITLKGALTGGGNVTVTEGNRETFAAMTVTSLRILDALTGVSLNGAIQSSGQVSITSRGDIIESSTGRIAATQLTTRSSTGTTLNSANQVTTFIATNSTSGDISLVNSVSLDITGIDETGGNVSITNARTLTVSGLVAAAGAGTVVLTAEGATSDIVLNADVQSATGTLTLSAGENVTLNAGNMATTGAINLTAGKAISEAGAGFVTSGLLTTQSSTGTTLNGVNQVTGFNATNTAAGDIRLANTGLLNIVAISETGGNVSISNAGTVTVSGAVTAAGSGGVDLTATGLNSDILTNSNIQSATGALTLDAGKNVTLNAGNLTTSGSVSLTAVKRISEAGTGFISGGLLTTHSSTGTALNSANQVTGFNATNSAAGDIRLSNSGLLNVVAISETGGDVSITNAGTMTVLGAVTAAGGGAVDLTTTGAASDIVVNANIQSATGALTLSAGNDLTINTGNLSTTGGINLTAGHAISEAGSGLVAGGLLTTQSSTGTTLNSANQVTSLNAKNSTSGNISLMNTGPLNVVLISETGGNISLTNAGTIRVLGPVTAAGGGAVDLTATGGTNDIVVNANIQSATGDLTLNAGENVTLNAGNLITSGGVNLTAGKGINEAGTGFIAGGLLTTLSSTGTTLNVVNQVTGFHATNTSTGDITLLNGLSLNITGITEAGGNILVTNTGTLSTTGAVSTAANGNILLVSSGTETIGASVTAGGSGTVDLTATGAASDILVNANVESVTGVLTLDAGKNITLDSGNVSTSGNVNMIAGKAISEAGSGFVTGGLLTAQSSTGTTLNSANQVTSFNATNTTSGDISLTNSLSLEIAKIDESGGNVLVTNAGTVTVSGPVTTTGGGTVALTATGGTSDILVNANIQSATGDLTLNAGENVTLNAGNLITSGGVNLTAGKGISEAGTGFIAGGLLTTLSSTGTTLNVANQVTGFHATNSTSGDITLLNGLSLNITGITEAGGNISVTNTDTLSTTGAVSTAANGNILLVSSGAETIGASVTAGGSGTVSLTATGVTGDILVNANVESATGALTLDAGKNITLDSGNVSTSGSVNMIAGKNITETGSGFVTSGLLTTHSSTGTTLNSANQVTSFNATNITSGEISLTNSVSLEIVKIDETGGNVSVTNAGTVTVSGPVTATGGGAVALSATGGNSEILINANIQSATGALAISAGENVTLKAGNLITSGGVNLTAGKRINEAGTGFVAGGLLTTLSSTGTTLNVANQVTGFHATNTTSGDITLLNGLLLNITGITETGGNISVTNNGALSTTGAITTAANGNILLVSSGTETIGASVTAGGSGTVDLTATGAASDIVVNANVESATGALTLDAGKNLTLNSGNASTSGNVNMIAGKAISEAGSGFVTSGLLTTHSSTGTTLNSANQVSAFNATNTTSGDISLTNSVSLEIAEIDETGGNVSVTNAGTVTVLGPVTATSGGAVALTATGGTSEILVNANIQSATGDLTLSAGENVTLNAGSLSTSGAINLLAGKTISEAGTGFVTGGLLTTQSSAGTTLNRANQVTSFNATNTSSGNISLVNSGALNVVSISETGGNVSLANAGTVTVSGPVMASGGGAIALKSTGATSDILVNANIHSSTGGLTLDAGENVTLNAGNLSTSGAIHLTAGKAISEAGTGFVTGGLLTTQSSTGTTLNIANQVTGFSATNTSSGDISLANRVSIEIAKIDESGGYVSVTNTGTVTVSGPVTTTGGGAVDLTATGATSDILVNANIRSATGDLTLSADKSVTLNAGNLNTTGSVNLIAGKAISEAGSGFVTSGFLKTVSSTGTTLNSSNQIMSFNATNTTSGDIRLMNAGLLNVLAISESGGNVTITNDGTMTVSGPVTAAGGGAVALTTTGTASDIVVNANIQSVTGALTLIAGEDVTLNAGNLTTSGSVNLTAGKGISESGAGLIAGGLLTTQSSTGTTLNTANQVTGFKATNTTSGDISLVNTGLLDVLAINEAGGNLSITNAGTITVSGAVTADGGGAVDLTASGVTSDILVNATIQTATGPLTLDAGENLTLYAGNLSTSGSVNLTAGKSIEEAATGFVAAGLLTTLSSTGTKLNSANQVSSFHATNTTSGNISLVNSLSLNITGITETGGNITVTNAGTLSTTGTVSTAANGSIVLLSSGTETIGASVTAGGGGTVVLKTTGAASDILVNADIQSATGDLTLDAGHNITLKAGNVSTIGSVNLAAGNAISEAGTGFVSGGLLTTQSSTGTNLNTANHVTSFTATNTMSGDVSLVNTGPLIIVSISESGGDVSIANAGTMTVSGPVTASGGGAVNLTASGGTSEIVVDANIQSSMGPLTLIAGENISLNAGNLISSGSINLTAGHGISEAGVGFVKGGLLTTQSSTGTTLNAANQVTGFHATNTASGDVNLTNTGLLNVVAISESGGSVFITNSGTMTVSGSVTAAGGGAVALTTTGGTSDIMVNANIQSATGALTLGAGKDITLNAGSLITSGSVNLTAVQAISEAGTGFVKSGLLTTQSSTGTTLNAANQVTAFHATNTISGDISLVNSGLLNIVAISETGGNVSITNAGVLTVSGPVTATGGGAVALTSIGGSNDILVDANIQSDAGDLTLSAGHDLIIQAGKLSTTGGINLTAGHLISEAGTGFVTGGLLTTHSSAGTTLNAANQVTGFHATNTTSGDISLVNGLSLNITGITEAGGNISVTNTGTLSTAGAISTAANGNILLVSSGTETIGASVTAGGSGTVNLTATGVTSDIVVNANVESATGQLTLGAGKNIAINTGNVSTSSNVNMNAGKAISEVGSGFVTGSLLTTHSSTGTTLNAANQVTTFNATNTTSGDISLTNSVPLDIAKIDETGGNVSVTNAGTVTVSGPVTTTGGGTVALTSTGGTSDILVNANIQSAAGDLTLSAGENVTLNAGNLITSGSVNLTAGKGIREAGTGFVTGGLLTTNSSTGTTLNGANQVSGFSATNTASGDISLMNTGPLNVVSISETGGNVAVANAGTMTVSGPVTAAGGGAVDLTATGASSDILVNANIESVTGGLTLIAGEDVTLNAGNLSTSGGISLTAAKGISEAGTGFVAGGLLTTLSSTGTMLNASNQVTSFHATNTISGDISLTNSGLLNIVSISETGGNISVTNAGTITASGPMTATGSGAVALTATGATSDILVNANIQSATGALTLIAGEDVTLNAGNLITSSGINLTAGNAIREAGSGFIMGSLLTTQSSTGTILNASNQITKFTATNTTSGDISLVNTGFLNVLAIGETGGNVSVTNAGTLTVSGPVTAAGGGAVDMTATGATSDILVNANIQSVTGALTLIAGEDVTLNAGNLTTSGSVILTAAKGISEAGTGSVTGGLLTTHSSTGTQLNTSNQVTGFNATNLTSGDISLVNGLSLNITGITEAGGNITVTNTGTLSTTGAVSTASGNILLVSSGTETIGASVTAGGSGTVVLSATGGTSDILVNANIQSTTGALTFIAGEDVTLNAGNISTSGSVDLTAGNAIREAGAGFIKGGLLTTQSSTGTILNAANQVANFKAENTTSGDISLANAGLLNIVSISETGGNISVTNAGTLTVSGPVTAAGGGAVDLTATGATSDILVNANIQSVTGALTLIAGEDVKLNSGNLTTSGSVILTAANGISEAGTGSVTGGLLTTHSSTGTLLNTANQVTGFNATNTTSGDISLVNGLSLSITGIAEAGGNITVTDTGSLTTTGAVSTAGNGNILLVSSGTETIRGTVTAGGGGTVDLNATGGTSDIVINANIQSGTGALTLDAGKDLTLQTGSLITSSSVHLTAVKAISELGTGFVAGGLLTTQSSTGTILNSANQITSFNATNTTSGNISLVNGLSLNIAGITEVGGNITVTNTGTLSTTGAVTTAANGNILLLSSGTETISAAVTAGGSGTVDLSATGVTSDIVVNANVQSTTGALTLSAGDDLTIKAGNLSTTGEINLTAGHAISEAGTGSVTGDLLKTQSTSGTTLNNANVVTGFNATNTTSGDISLVNGLSLNITGITETGGNITVTNTGTLSTTGAITTAANGNILLLSSGTETIGASMTAGGSGTVNLIATGGTSDILVNANIQSATGALTLDAGKNVTLNNGSLITSGSVNLTAVKGINEAGTGSVTGGLLTIHSSTGITLNTVNQVTGFNATNSISGDISLVNGVALNITGITEAGGNVTVTNTGTLSTTGAVTTAANGNIVLISSGTETIGASVTAGGSGTVNLAATGATSDILVNASIQSAIGALTLSAGEDLTINGGSLSTTDGINLSAGNAISEAGTGFVSGSLLTTHSSAGTTLNTANQVTSFRATNTLTGDISLVNGLSLNITGMTETGGNIRVTNTGTLSTTGAVTTAANGNILLISSGTETIGAIVSAGGSGKVDLSASTSTSDIVVNANIQSDAGALRLDAGKDITLTTGSLITSGSVNLAAVKAINEAGSGSVTGGLLTTHSSTGTTLNTANQVTGFNATNTTSGSISLVNGLSLNVTGISETGGTITVTNTGTLSTTGAVSTTADGNILLLASGTETIGATVTAGGGGTVDLKATTATSDIVVNANIQSATGPLTLDAGKDVTLNAGRLTTIGNVNLNAGNAIREAGAGFVTGGLLTTQSSTGTLLTSANQVTSFKATNTTSGDLILVNGPSLEIIRIDETGGNVSVKNTGTLTVSGLVTATGGGAVDLMATGGTSDILVNANVQSVTGTLSFSAGENVTLNTGILTTSGSVNLSAGNAISEAGTGFVSGGLLTTNSSTGTTLNVGNQVTGFHATNTTSGDISLINGRSLDITGITEAGGNITVTNTGTLSTSGAVAAAANGNILLVSSGTETIGANMTAGGTGAVTLDSTAGDIMVLATVASTSGAITAKASGSISEAGTGAFSTAGLLTTKSTTGQTLDGANSIANFLGNNSSSGDIRLVNVVSLNVVGINEAGGNVSVLNAATLTVSGVVTATSSGTVTLVTTGSTSDILVKANIQSISGAVTLNAGENIRLESGALTTDGAISLTAGMAISEATTSFVKSGLLTTHSSTGTTLNSLNQVMSFNATNTSNGDISLVNDLSLNITGISETGGNIHVTSTRSLVTTGAVTAVSTGGNGNITLDASLSETIGAVITAVGSGSVTLNSAGGDILLQDRVASTSGAITTFASGRIAESGAGAFSTSGLLSTNSSTGQVLTGSNAVGSFQAINSLSGDIDLINGRSLNVLGIDQRGGKTSVLNDGTITISGSVKVTGGETVRLTTTGATSDIIVNADVTSVTGALTLIAFESVTLKAGNLSTGGDINLDAGKSIIESGVGVVTGRQLITNSSTGTTLNNRNHVAWFNATNQPYDAANVSPAGISLTNQGSLTVTGIFDETGGSVRVNETGTLTTTGDVVTSRSGSIQMNATETETISSRVVAGGSGSVSLNSIGGDVIVSYAGSVASLSGGGVSLSAMGDLVLLHPGSLTPAIRTTGTGIISLDAGQQVLYAPGVFIQSGTGIVTNPGMSLAVVAPHIQNVTASDATSGGVVTVTGDVAEAGDKNYQVVIGWVPQSVNPAEMTYNLYPIESAGMQTIGIHTYHSNPTVSGDPSLPIKIEVYVQLDPFIRVQNNSGYTFVTLNHQPVLPPATGVSNPNAEIAVGMPYQPPAASPAGVTVEPVPTILQTVYAQIPGEGLVSFVFDLTPPVKYLHFPDAQVADELPHQVVTPLSELIVTDFTVRTPDTGAISERLVFLEVEGSDGSEAKQYQIQETDLDDLLDSIRNGFGKDQIIPDGIYRVLLQEPGESRQRLVLEFKIVNGSIEAESDTTRDRPPTSNSSNPQTAEPKTNETDNTQPPPASSENEQSDNDTRRWNREVADSNENHDGTAGERHEPQTTDHSNTDARRDFVVGHARRAWMRATQIPGTPDSGHFSDDTISNDESRDAENEMNSAESSVLFVTAASLGMGIFGAMVKAPKAEVDPAVPLRLNRAARLVRKWLTPRGVSE